MTEIAPPPELDSTFRNPGDIGSTWCEWSSDEIQKHELPTDILLITVNPHEFRGCYSSLQLNNNQIRRTYQPELSEFVDFGKFGDGNEKVKVALIRCAMGPTAALLSVENFTRILSPKVVLFVGLCGTLKPEKAKLGDVVISAKLITHGDKKIEKDEQWRGEKGSISKKMGGLIKVAGDGWKPPLKDPSQGNDIQVHCQAVMLSGPELVNNLERRRQLHEQHPQAIAIEMEGKGLYEAALDLVGIEWAVVKGVSDLADGTKTDTDKWQPFASAMAASVVYNMFTKYPVIKNWPNYQTPGQAMAATNTSLVTPPELAPVSSQPNLIEQFLQSIKGTKQGARTYKGRTIQYTTSGRFHSLSEPWVYDVIATDVESGICVRKEHFDTTDEAISYAVQELVKQLKERNIMQE